MRTRRVGKSRAGRPGGMVLAALVSVAFVHADAVRPTYRAEDPAAGSTQVPFEQVAADLASADSATRLRAVQLLKRVSYPEAAIPLAALVLDPQDEVQLEAIAAELNIFLAEPIAAKKRMALVVQVRSAVQSEPAFAAGPNALGATAVPAQVLIALRTAARDENPRVALEALYGFGVVAVQPGGDARRGLLRDAGPDIAAFIGSSNASMRYAAVRVLGRVFARRAGDAPIESTIGDALITALNDNDRAVRAEAMHALGAMRYERGVRALTDLFAYYGKGGAAEAALDGLAHIGHPTSVPVFVAQLASKTPSLRAIAIEGLARSGDKSQLPAIQAVLDTEREQAVSLAGAFALVLLGNAGTDPVADSLSRPRMRDQAKRYLIEIAPGRSGGFSHQLLDSDPEVRIDTIDALGLAGDPAAISVIDPLTKDPDPQVALAAERAVARLRPSPVR